jgi:hypothetical protein
MSALLLALAGCGGGHDDSSGGLPAGAPKPAQSLGTAVAAFNKALARPTCRALEPFVHSQNRQSAAGRPLTVQECKLLRAKLGSALPGFTPRKTATFGTAGIVDARAAGQPQTVVFALDVDRLWKFAFAIPAHPQVGTDPSDGDGFDSSLRRFVGAVRKHDCAQLATTTSVSSPAYQAAAGDPAKFCHALLDPVDPSTFVAQARGDRSAHPELMGATSDFAFYGIGFKSGRYDTIVMITQPTDAPPAQIKGKSRYGFFELYNARRPRS